MITKIFILISLLFIAGSLFSGLFFLVQDPSKSKRTVKALTLRVSISVSLFLFLILAYSFGLIKPHGI